MLIIIIIIIVAGNIRKAKKIQSTHLIDEPIPSWSRWRRKDPFQNLSFLRSKNYAHAVTRHSFLVFVFDGLSVAGRQQELCLEWFLLPPWWLLPPSRSYQFHPLGNSAHWAQEPCWLCFSSLRKPRFELKPVITLATRMEWCWCVLLFIQQTSCRLAGGLPNWRSYMLSWKHLNAAMRFAMLNLLFA